MHFILCVLRYADNQQTAVKTRWNFVTKQMNKRSARATELIFSTTEKCKCAFQMGILFTCKRSISITQEADTQYSTLVHLCEKMNRLIWNWMKIFQFLLCHSHLHSLFRSVLSLFEDIFLPIKTPSILLYGERAHTVSKRFASFSIEFIFMGACYYMLCYICQPASSSHNIYSNGHFVSLKEFPCAYFLRFSFSVIEIQLVRFRASHPVSQHKITQANACKMMVKGVQNHQIHQRAPSHMHNDSNNEHKWMAKYLLCVNYSITHHNSNQFSHSDDAKLRSLASECVCLCLFWRMNQWMNTQLMCIPKKMKYSYRVS